MGLQFCKQSKALIFAASFAAGLGTAAATGIAQSDAAQFAVVEDYADFEATFIGPRISDPDDAANYFVIQTDGTIAGTWFGKTLSGAWRWEDGYFCRSLSAPRAAPEDCQQWSVAGDQARLVRDRGTGEATFYAIRQ